MQRHPSKGAILSKCANIEGYMHTCYPTVLIIQYLWLYNNLVYCIKKTCAAHSTVGN